MSAMYRAPKSRATNALALLCLVAVAACSGNEEPEPLPSQTVTQVTPQLAEPPPPPLPPPVREVPVKRDTVKVIESGGDVDRPTTLAEASRLAKARKRTTPESVAVINDDNLHEYARDAEVIVLESPPAVPMTPPETAAGDDPAGPDDGVRDDAVRDEEYWRGRALELRMGWRRSLDEIAELELESAALRQQFYAEEDPYIRDSQLKPAWDRVLDRLDRLRQRAVRYERELDAFVEEGRRAGALQGWLNQGWELEPTPEERERLRRFEIHQPAELESHEAIDVGTTIEQEDNP